MYAYINTSYNLSYRGIDIIDVKTRIDMYIFRFTYIITSLLYEYRRHKYTLDCNPIGL